MQSTHGKLDVEWFNLGQARHDNPEVDITGWQRPKFFWNVYFHGFNDRYDDIAYVKQETKIEPGIYDTVVNGIDCLLFAWAYDNGSYNHMKGLIVERSNEEMVADAFKKYTCRQEFI